MILVASCWVAVLAAGLLPPVLPAITKQFADRRNVDLLVGLIATIPSLTVAVLAIPIGALTDRLGARPILLCGLIVYAVAGVSPYWLNKVWPIIGARALSGIGEGAAMIGGTTLLGSRFFGRRRHNLFAVQIATSNILGIFVLLAGGVLGLRDWHTPFLAYGAGLLLFVCALLFTHKPALYASEATIVYKTSKRPLALAGEIATLCGLELLAVFIMFTILVQLSYILPARGAINSAAVGVGIAFGAAGIGLGAFASFAQLAMGWRFKAFVGFAIAAFGLCGVAAVTQMTATYIFSAIAGIGAGLVTPTLLSALVAMTPPSILGRIISLWTIATFAAQFLNPPIYVALRATFGGQPQAMMSAAIATFVLAALVLGATSRVSKRL